MIKNNKLRVLLLFSAFSLLSGCVSNPDDMPTYKFSSDIVSNSPSNSIITSVASKETLKGLKLPFDPLMNYASAWPPQRINGEPTIRFAKKFAGKPIDGNFQVEVLPGIKKMAINYTNGKEIREYVIEFSAEPGHTYFAKFLIRSDKEDSSKHTINPVVCDLTKKLRLETKFISDETVGIIR
ncbi:MAG: hypothetical protein V4732_16490 [Pseudomonadota bacterium]